jgi:hypothetical protein
MWESKCGMVITGVELVDQELNDREENSLLD